MLLRWRVEVLESTMVKDTLSLYSSGTALMVFRVSFFAARMALKVLTSSIWELIVYVVMLQWIVVLQSMCLDVM